MNKTKTSKRDYSGLLIWSAILVTVARYIGAFLASDLGEITGLVSTGITVLMGLTGLGMGILDVMGGAYIFDGWRRNMPKSGGKWSARFKVETAFVLALFTTGIFILVPFTMSRIFHVSMAAVLGAGLGGWVWSVAVNIAPYLLIGGVVTSQANVVGVNAAEVSAEPTLAVSNPALQPSIVVVSTSDRRQQLLKELNSGNNNISSLSEKLGVSRNTIYADFSAMEKAGKVKKNGHGWEVGDGYR